jgi:hypothetical protein
MLPLQNRIAIINWKEFHRAKLYKKRLIRDLDGGCIKKSFLSTEHYIILNALRGLPLDRGMSVEAYDIAYARLARTMQYSEGGKSYLLEPICMPFGMSTYWMQGFIKANILAK